MTSSATSPPSYRPGEYYDEALDAIADHVAAVIAEHEREAGPYFVIGDRKALALAIVHSLFKRSET